MSTQVLFYQVVNSSMQMISVIDRIHSYSIQPVPTGLTSSGYRSVHDVVCYQEESLELNHKFQINVLEIFVSFLDQKHSKTVAHYQLNTPTQGNGPCESFWGLLGRI